jgi:hypothetical protein
MPKLSPYQKELLNQLKAMNPYFIQDYYIKEISTYQDDKCITLETDYIDNCYYSITICYDLGYDLYNFKVKRFCENHKSNTYEYLEKEGFYFDQIYPFIDNLLNGYYDHKFEEKSIIEERNTKKRRLKEEDEHKIKAKDLAFLSIDFIIDPIIRRYKEIVPYFRKMSVDDIEEHLTLIKNTIKKEMWRMKNNCTREIAETLKWETQPDGNTFCLTSDYADCLFANDCILSISIENNILNIEKSYDLKNENEYID